MSREEQEFIAKLRATFKLEAEEHLQAISTSLLELEKSPSSAPPTVVEKVFREVHSLKGAARAVDLSEIEAICHAMESVFASWKSELTTPSPQVMDTLHRALDEIRAILESPNAAGPSGQLIGNLNHLQIGAASAPKSEQAIVTPAAAAVPAPCPLPDKSPTTQTVRIPIEKLDRRLLQAEDMLSLKAMTGARAAELRELAGRFEQWRHEWAKISIEVRSMRQILEHSSSSANGTIINFLDWNADYLHSLDQQVRAAASQADQDRHAVAKRVDDLMVDSKKLIMLPFSTVAEVFPKVVRDLCREQGKEAEIVVRGGEVEIDKRILEELKDALLHVLRNCVDHGVELPEDRIRRNKSPRATIQIQVSAVEGDKVEIQVSDDGSGIDVHGVKESAIEHGIISPQDAQRLGDADALNLVFHSDVSTRTAVTAISGRGLGMAIVRAKADKLGGEVSLESRPDHGTTLRLVLPLTLATFRGVVVSVADRVFVFPTANLERALRILPAEIRTVENRQVISVRQSLVCVTRLQSILDLPPSNAQVKNDTPVPVVVVRSGDLRIGIIVDNVLREEEVLVKPLRKPLVRVRNIAGATVLASGKTALVLNVTDLMECAKSHGAAPAVEAEARTILKPSRRVLVVEDSITSRMLLKGILESAGFDVRTAVDGLDALAALQEDKFALVVSDVEMPRMTGLDLAQRIRADGRLADLPVILVTALETREERERGLTAGASAYLAKSSFDQSNLLEAIGRLI
jgi:two-component system chemotaxis sensor kinase CheA